MIQGNIAMPRNSKKSVSLKPITARPRLVEDFVHSPTVPGAREAVQRVFDGLDAMLKRKQIGKMEYRAAMHIRNANDVVYGSPGGVMDLDRVRGGGMSGPQAAPPYLEASETLRKVKQWTYALDHKLIELVVISGYSIVSAAQIVHGRVPTRTEKEEAGVRLRFGLMEVAERLWGRAAIEADDRRDMGAFHAAGATDYNTAAPGSVERGRVVHATGQRIFGDARQVRK